MKRKVQAILNDAKTHNRPLTVLETYRSVERQRELFDKGVTKLKNVGVHNYGLAADLVFLVNGKPDWSVDYDFLGHLARSYGLVWGGDWTGFVDSDHVQFCKVSDQSKLFNGSWYPDDTYSVGG